jgi:uncharacterized protein
MEPDRWLSEYRCQMKLAQIGARCFETMSLVPRGAGRGLIAVYRYTLSPWIGFHCRHLPTCSSYADEALARYGLWAGGWMTLARVLRCQPWGTSGIDNVPSTLSPSSRWYLPWRYARWRGVNDKQSAAAQAAPPPTA